MSPAPRFTRFFAQICAAGLRSAGGKTASLGEMYRALRPQGVSIPGSFAITTEACRGCFASLFTDHAVHYRSDNGFEHFTVARSIAVQKMVRADEGPSGVMFTLDTLSGFRDVLLISASYGLGENILRGERELTRNVSPGARALLPERGGSAGACQLRHQDRGPLQRACRPSDAHGRRVGQGRSRRSPVRRTGPPRNARLGPARGAARGVSAGDHSAAGGDRARGRLADRTGSGAPDAQRRAAQIGPFRTGEVLVTDNTTPDWEPIMHRAAAIVTSRRGSPCHAPLVARAFGIAALVGTANATERLSEGQQVTVFCAGGDAGRMYAGKIPFEVRRTDLARLARPHTTMMLILANPDIALQMSVLPNDDIALARMEFIITAHIKAHPMAPLYPERRALERLTRGHVPPRELFVHRLAEGRDTIGAAFYPKPVIVRMSDFKTNEYAGLRGHWFEPKEQNPMLSFRGAARDAHPAYAQGFALECAALRPAREIMGLVDLRPMIRFCRRLEEGAAAVARMRELGLEGGKDGLEIYLLCEIPNNLLLSEEFRQIFDGFSIGSNDLTHSTLGVDRDSATVAFEFDERDPGVRKSLRLAAEGCRRNARHCGICAQAPSDYPEITAERVRLGIDSSGLNPDALIRTTLRVLELERQSAAEARQSPA